MNDPRTNDCERFEAMMVAWFDEHDLTASDRQALTAHLAGCPSCRESFELSGQMEEALVSRRAEVPAVDAFMPALSAAPAPAVHPGLLAVFRAILSPAGISIILVMWSTMLTFRYRDAIASALEWKFSPRLSTFGGDVSGFLLSATGGDSYVLIAIYVVLTLILLGSTGAITMKYIRHS